MVNRGRSYPRRSIGIELNPQANALRDEPVLISLIQQLIQDGEERDQEIRSQVDQLTSIVRNIQNQLNTVLNTSHVRPHLRLDNAPRQSQSTAPHNDNSKPPSTEPPHSTTTKPELLLVDEGDAEHHLQEENATSPVLSLSPTLDTADGPAHPRHVSLVSNRGMEMNERRQPGPIRASKMSLQNIMDSCGTRLDGQDENEALTDTPDGSRGNVDSSRLGKFDTLKPCLERERMFSPSKVKGKGSIPPVANGGGSSSLANLSSASAGISLRPSDQVRSIQATPLLQCSLKSSGENVNAGSNDGGDVMGSSGYGEALGRTVNGIAVAPNHVDTTDAFKDRNSTRGVRNTTRNSNRAFVNSSIGVSGNNGSTSVSPTESLKRSTFAEKSSELPKDGNTSHDALQTRLNAETIKDLPHNAALDGLTPPWVHSDRTIRVEKSEVEGSAKTVGVPSDKQANTKGNNVATLTWSFEAAEPDTDSRPGDAVVTEDERVAAMRACNVVLDSRADVETVGPSTPVNELEELPPPSADVISECIVESVGNRNSTECKPSLSKSILDEEVIVISDGEDDPIRPVMDNHDDIYNQDKEEDIEVSTVPVHKSPVAEQDDYTIPPPNNTPKKRKRVCETQKEHAIHNQQVYVSCEEPLNENDEPSIVSNDEEFDCENPSTPRRYSADVDFTPIPYHRRTSATPSDSNPTSPRPSKLPRFESATLTNDECSILVREADLMALDFYKEDGTNPKNVVDLLDRAGRSGSIEALTRLGRIYLKGVLGLAPGAVRIRRNFGKATSLCNTALRINPDYPAALNLRGDLWLCSSGKRSSKTQKAFRLFKKSAAQDDPDGQCRLGQWWMSSFVYATTDTRRRNCLKSAIIELEKAVDMDSGKAASLLGSIYENDGEFPIYYEMVDAHEGRHLPDQERVMKAKGYYFQSMNLRCAEGTNDVAACYEVAYADVDRNFDMAAELYKRSFELGHLGAAANLALLYELGAKHSFPERVDGTQALKWYNVGYKVHCPVATHHLAFVYDNGSLATEDKNAAERLYQAAINFADDVDRDYDIVPKAQDDLSALYITKALLQKPDASDAIKKLKKMRCNTKGQGTIKVAAAKKHLGWVAASRLNPALYGHMQSAEEALPNLVKMLGEKNASDVADYVRKLCANVRSDSADVTSIKEKLSRIVDEQILSMIGL